MSNPKSLNELNEEIQKLNAKQLQLNEDLYDRKITKSKFVLGLIAFVILSAVLITATAIVLPAALMLSVLSAVFFSKIAHVVSNRINSFINGVKLDRIEKQLTELESQAKLQSENDEASIKKVNSDEAFSLPDDKKHFYNTRGLFFTKDAANVPGQQGAQNSAVILKR